MKEEDNKSDYSWLKVHLKSIKKEILVLISGVVGNFRKVSWYKKGLAYEFVAMICIVLFLAVFFYIIYIFTSLIQ